MDAFENIISQLLQEDGFWVLQSVKVDLNKDEKVSISKPTTPRPEIDIIAYSCKENLLYLIEAKSYIDSLGVQKNDLVLEHDIQEGRYKLLTSKIYRDVVSKRLKNDFIVKGFINKNTKIHFGLIAGKIHKNEYLEIKKIFDKKKWLFWGPEDIKQKLINLSKKGYEDNSVTMTAKLLLKSK